MKSSMKHIVISTIVCALTLVIFLAFYGMSVKAFGRNAGVR